MHKNFFILFIFILVVTLTRYTSFSQSSVIGSSVSRTVELEGIPEGYDTNGAIVVLDNGKYRISEISADSRQVGVITRSPAITLRRSLNPNVFDVYDSGTAFVKASNTNGKISVGDYVTSSNQPGIAVKSSNPEFVLGVALEDFDSESGLLKIEINPTYVLPNANTGLNLLSLLRSSAQSISLTPLNSLRYILAAVIGAGSFVFGFIIFSKITGSGIQALGRNPLARRTIEINIAIEFILNIALIVFGLGIAYLILVL
jgi:hypothetical protein